MKTFIVKRETGDIELTMNEVMHLFFDLERYFHVDDIKWYLQNSVSEILGKEYACDEAEELSSKIMNEIGADIVNSYEDMIEDIHDEFDGILIQKAVQAFESAIKDFLKYSEKHTKG